MKNQRNRENHHRPQCSEWMWRRWGDNGTFQRTNLIIFLLFLEKSQKCFVSSWSVFCKFTLAVSFLFDFSSSSCSALFFSQGKIILGLLFFSYFLSSNSVKPMRVRRVKWREIKFKKKDSLHCAIKSGSECMHWFQNEFDDVRQSPLDQHALLKRIE